MAPLRSTARRLADWRAALAALATTTSGSIAREDAERTERRARWAYEDKSVAQHDQHGRPETLGQRVEWVARRSHGLRQDAADGRSRSTRMADEAEFERELGE